MRDLIEKLLKRNIHLSNDNDRIKIKYDGDIISEDILSEIRNNKNELLIYLKKYTVQAQVKNIKNIGLDDSYVLSSAQKRLWVLSQFEDGNIAYNMPSRTILNGEYDIKKFNRAIYSAIDRHEILRTIFREDEYGNIRQKVLPKEELGFYIDYQDYRENDNDKSIVAKVNAYIENDSSRSFDLKKGPLMRAALLRTKDNQYVFYYNMHHIISDGWSMNVLSNDVLTFYEAFKKDDLPKLPELRIQYKDYSSWQIKQMHEEGFKTHRNYWLNQFSGEIPVIELPFTKKRPILKSFNGYKLSTFIDKETTLKLKSYTHQEGGSLFMGLIATLTALFYRYTSQEEFIIGTPVAGRDHVDLENQIGFYVNILALKSEVKESDSFKTLFNRVKQTALDAYTHQMYPFDELVEELSLKRDTSRSALFDIMALLQNIGENSIDSTFIDSEELLEIKDLGNSVSKFDVELTFQEVGDYISIMLVYNDDIYEKEMMKSFIFHYKNILNGLLSDSEQAIITINYLSEEEKSLLLYTFNDTAVSYPRDKTLVDLFEEQVEKTPNAIALVFEDKQFTYQMLNEKSNQLAHQLCNIYNIQKGNFIGILLDRSELSIIAILGILKSGGVYIPIDPEYPSSRKQYIVKDTGIHLLISSTVYLFTIDYYEGPVFAIDVELEDQGSAVSNLRICLEPSDLAYIIYTSGSTGVPKGVMAEHRSVVRLVKSANYIELKGTEVLLSTGAICFDAVTFEYWSMLLNGGTLCICKYETLLSTTELSKEISRLKVNTMWFTAGWLNQLVDTDISLFKGLDTILAGGEKLSRTHIMKLHHHYPKLKLINGYGPTENTTFSLTYHIKDVPSTIPIGFPISNSEAYVLNKMHHLVPIGVVGEICLSGDGLARGYLNHPVLTAEKFISNPFRLGERMYKTGDLGRWLSDGSIEFLGRKDDQVKIRGYRIELGEIEHALCIHEKISSSVVVVKEDELGEKNIVAYVVSQEMLKALDLRTYLSKVLPEYMIPAYFIQLESFPLTPNGKINKKMLPDPDGMNIGTGVEYIGARNDIEASLVNIWESVLDRSPIGIHDNFFDLGGHSLKAIRLMSQLYKELGIKVSLKDIFSHAVLSDQAVLLSDLISLEYEAIPCLASQLNYSVSAGQRRLWVLSQFEGGSVSYNMPFHLQLDGSYNIESFKDAIYSTIERHEILRTVFKEDEMGELRQWVMSKEELNFKIEYKDYRDDKEAEEKVRSYIEGDRYEAFDLERGPLLRAALLQLKDDQYAFYYNMHHIISDGWSMNVLAKDVLSYYESYKKNESPYVSPLRIQYKDYSAWQLKQLESENFKEYKSYWLAQLQGDLPILDLPVSKTRPVLKSNTGHHLLTVIDKEASLQLRKYSQEQGGSLFIGLLSSLTALFNRYTSGNDFIIGSPIAGRDHGDLEDQIGFYVNTLVLRTAVTNSDDFESLFTRTKERVLDAYQHQSYPFDRLVEELNLKRDTSRSAIFDVMLSLQNTVENKVDVSFPDQQTTAIIDGGKCASKFDMEFTFREFGDYLSFSVIYNEDIYEKEMVEGLMYHYKNLLKGMLLAPKEPLSGIKYLSKEEETKILSIFNDTAVSYPKDKTIVDLFEEQVKKSADKIALVFEDKEFTYRELNEISNQLACYLQKHYTINADDLVGIKLERSEWIIIAILGILKSGGAYVPIDPTYPEERINYMLNDSKCKVLIDYLELSLFNEEKNKYNKNNLPISSLPHNLAYVIYTSGTTGKPKGSLITHINVVRLFKTEKLLFDFNSTDVWTLFHSYCFDFSVWEMYGALLHGGKLVIVPSLTAKDPVEFVSLLLRERVTVLNQTPSSFYNVIKTELRESTSSLKLRYVIFGGESLKPIKLNEWYKRYPETKLINMYGITETTVHVTYKEIGESEIESNSKNIGKCIPTLSCYVLDEFKQLVPIGVEGELYVGGEGVAKGYLNRETLTAERFLESPYKAGEILYRSGDKVRILSSGELEYIGRKDDQVKVRGYRIELGEIEYALQTHELVNEAVVLALTDEKGDKSIAAYVVSSFELNIVALRSYLSKHLPDYMLPSHFVQLEKLPLTPNGKIDKRSLPSPDRGSMDMGVKYIAPRNLMEEKLVKIWEDILQRDKIGMKDDFFTLGGHSLLATRLLSRVEKNLDVKIDISNFFMNSTIDSLSQVITTLEWMKNKSKEVNSESDELII